VKVYLHQVYLSELNNNTTKMKTLNEMNESELRFRYTGKASDSFKTKFNLYLFHKWLENPDKLDASILNQNDFDEFKIESDLVDYYVSYYLQELETELLCNNKTIKETANKIFDFNEMNKAEIEKLKKHYSGNYHSVFSFEDFKMLVAVDNENFKCHYCGVTIDMILQLVMKGKVFKKHVTRGFNLEIDRKRPNEEYTKDNCVLCCYWCNNAKTDEFSHDEFVDVGKALTAIWQQRLTDEKQKENKYKRCIT
jgi:hypothetical protein